MLLTRANEAHAENKAHQLAQLIAGAPFVWQGKRVPVSVAYGAHGLAPGEDPREALAAADRAMYRQKRACDGNPASDPQALVRR